MAELLLMLLSPITFGARANASHINSTQHHNHAMANASVRMRRSSLDSQLHADRQVAHRQLNLQRHLVFQPSNLLQL